MACTFHAAVQLAFLVVGHLSQTGPPSSLDTVESSLGAIASLLLIWLSTSSHRRSVRPSNLAVAYMLARFLCYLVWIPAASQLHPPFRRTRIYPAVQACVSLVVLASEAQSKRSVIYPSHADEPPEATSSFVGNGLFLWINPILARAYKKPLDDDGIPVLDREAASKTLRQAILQSWGLRGESSRHYANKCASTSYVLADGTKPNLRVGPRCPGYFYGASASHSSQRSFQESS